MRKYVRKAFNFLTAFATLSYLFSALTPFISPVAFWPMTFLNLAYPFVALVLCGLIIGWAIINKRVALLLLLIFFTGFKNFKSSFALNSTHAFDYQKDSGDLRILSWNVRNFDNCLRSAESPTAVRRQMIDYIKKANADVILIQEFLEYDNPAYYSNTASIDSLGYHYHYVTNDFIFHIRQIRTLYGSAIFSKTPLLSFGKVVYPRLPVPESIAYADVNVGSKRIRLFTTHLVSMSLTKRVRDREDSFSTRYDSAFSSENNVYKKLLHYDTLHIRQAQQLTHLLNASPYPVILTGDFNSTPASYLYHFVKGSKRDVFVERGNGLGRTYSTLSGTLRIDYIFTDPLFKVKQMVVPHLYLSDHFPLVSDLKID